MKDYTYRLEPYQTKANRYDCPVCGSKKTFAKYISTETGEYLSDTVGRCNRESNCGYHYTPKQYFQDNPSGEQIREKNKSCFQASLSSLSTREPSYIDQTVVKASFFESAYLNNAFVLFLYDRFGSVQAEELVKKYCIGNSKKWPGATVFWQLDTEWKARTGKIMLYDRATGKRVKQPFNHVHWVHSILKLEDFHLKQCFFGEHLLDIEPSDKPIAIVESEKTAVIASLYFYDFIWLACGGLSTLSPERLKSLQDRKVILFPDLNGFEKWTEAAKDFPNITVSNLLETIATDQEREKGLDLADYLLRFSYLEFWTYPKEWDEVLPYQTQQAA
ncbi:DUF6371 domain-containing protein [Cytophagaceae bacterium YF14B1]|uniref:DUF6371 domain-containing protein n=1 Tax=Xanthocytophaga flava TaxID=3048013 RepID=A0AAE3QRA0_9BACT|nr:DUF6371 domain-containing protein [Xanthocytophaga flavus]MDJ1481750.1 DUF6371 domain-containing protein [Xanthocytophaga flavus]